MTPERWQQIRAVLEKALELAPSERSTFLNSACSSDQALRQEVETFLASQNDVRSGFLQSSTLGGTLSSGTKLGDYEVKSLLGSGGMGEVYRARDTRLDRDVAIKILPAVFATDAERLARFEREAKTLASLNHPNIAHIHGAEDAGSTLAIVMELVEGDDLSQRLVRGPIALAEALAIARQIAEAMQTAHDLGIVHRDLKPANVKVKSDGTVKILDFGLAKVAETQPDSSLSHSPTIMTSMPGTLLGTAAYMSPEQVKGQTADARSDVWAFGCLLFEMLTGRPAFAAATTSEIVASVLTTEPDIPRESETAVT